MGFVWRIIVLGLVISTVGGGVVLAADSKVDEHSLSRPEQVRVRKLDLSLVVDFVGKRLKGIATLDVERSKDAPKTAPLLLDTKGLVIKSVSLLDGKGAGAAFWKSTEFQLGEPTKLLGRALEIPLPADVDATQVRVTYETTGESNALQWLDAKGTAGGTFPFLFTQSQAILARTWIPIQDTPGVRIPYTAEVIVPEGLTAVMSADRIDSQTLPDASKVFRFEMKQAIPSYLIALAVGDLAFRPLGPRTGVFAEPSVVDKAAAEFADTEAMVATIEKRFGPYRWGRYDLLVLPPSFPFGGMENPKLTFATPTVIAGDRSLVALIAHELAHSWSGNLVTNATWRDFWLNEGFTTYLERRVMEDLYGQDRALMEASLGLRELKEELAAFDPRDQVLHIDLNGRDPDEAMTRVAYEKGALFLTTLEKAFGRETFDTFLKSYFDQYGFQSITTSTFVDYLQTNLFPINEAAAKTVSIPEWIEGPGLPANAPEAKSPRFGLVEEAASRFSKGEAAAKSLNTAAWTTQEWIHFLQSLPASLTKEQMAELDQAFGLTSRGNSEIAVPWLVLAIQHGYTPADPRIETFLTTIGRRKFLIPLYSELLKTSAGRARAEAIFEKAKGFYHPISRESVAKLLAKPQ